MKFILKVASLILFFLTNAYSETNGCQNINIYSKIIYCDNVILLKSEITELRKSDQISTSQNRNEQFIMLLQKKIDEVEDIETIEKNFEVWKNKDNSLTNDEIINKKQKEVKRLKAELECIKIATGGDGSNYMLLKKVAEKCIKLANLESTL